MDATTAQISEQPRTESIAGKTILLTGAGGSIGSALAKALTKSPVKHLVLLDHSEQNLHQIDLEIGALLNCCEYTAVIGDSGDASLLADLFTRFHPEVVYHAAAFKHVPLMESNPVAVVQNNAVGTNTLAKTARTYRVPNLIMLSTDKAVNPISIMGASKRIAEIALEYWSNSECAMRSLRLGNVLGTAGSVLPTFERQIAAGGPVTVTHADATRYFLSLYDAIDLILRLSGFEAASGIFIPKLGEPVRILDLAQHMVTAAGHCINAPIRFTGLRPGDKLSEQLVSEGESIESTIDPEIFRVRNERDSTARFEIKMGQLARNVEQRDICSLLETVGKFLPEYQPSASLVKILEVSSGHTV